MEQVQLLYFCADEAYIPMQETFLAEELFALEVGVSILPVLATDNLEYLALELNDDSRCGAVVFWMERMTVCARYFGRCLRLAGMIRKKKLFGGFFATLMAGEILEQEPAFDTIIEGYDLAAIARTIRDDNYGRHIVAPGDIDLDKYDLNLDFIRTPEKFSTVMHGYYASQVCPHSCAYCANTLRKDFGISYQVRSFSKVRRDIDTMREKFHCRSIAFKDPNFFFNKDAFKVLKYLQDCGLAISKNLDITLNEISEDLIQTLQNDYGITDMFFGLESFSQETLTHQLEKNISISRLDEIAGWIDQYDVNLFGLVMFGFPWQTREMILDDVRRAMELMRRCNRIWIRFTPYIPIPGTRLGEKHFAGATMGMTYRSKVEMFDTDKYSTRRLPYQEDFPGLDPLLLSRSWRNFFHCRSHRVGRRGRFLLTTAGRLLEPVYAFVIEHNWTALQKWLNGLVWVGDRLIAKPKAVSPSGP